MKYFGTDGIRGKVDDDLSSSIIKKTSKAIVRYYKINKLKPVLLIGNDSRISSDYITSILSTILLKNGVEIHNLGICSSPCLAYTTQKFNYPLGLMISASHNPYEFNGLKFFNSFGEKVNDEFEQNFEILMDKTSNLNHSIYTTTKDVGNLKQNYIQHLKTIKKFNFPCIFDCANGGTSEICKEVFPLYEKININPNGNNINLNAGCTHLEMLKHLCIKKEKIGFAFDGDGDRVHLIDTDGEIIAGDKILYILSKFFQTSGDTLVGTIYTNSGLERSLKQRNITLNRVPVGDKNVYKSMKDNHSILGGEDSGHIILKPYMNTGDGMLIAIILGNILQSSKLTLKELLKTYQEDYQGRRNLKNISNYKTNSLIEQLIEKHQKEGAKVIIRPSGTEPVLRLFAEHQSKETAEKILNELENTITSTQ